MASLDEIRWKLVQQRNISTASDFVYAVTTTKIFCRSSCAARLARRSNVKFYDNSAMAKAAGFRPCKRCKPEEIIPPNPLADLVSAARAQIHDQSGHVTVSEVAKNLGVSSRHLDKAFIQVMGFTTASYAAQVRRTKSDSSFTVGCTPVHNNSEDTLELSLVVPFAYEIETLRESGFYHDPSSYQQLSELILNFEH